MRPPNSDMKCSGCYFWIKGEKMVEIPIPKDNGRCHRYPPVRTSADCCVYRFPIVDQNQWCGEWKPGYSE